MARRYRAGKLILVFAICFVIVCLLAKATNFADCCFEEGKTSLNKAIAAGIIATKTVATTRTFPTFRTTATSMTRIASAPVRTTIEVKTPQPSVEQDDVQQRFKSGEFKIPAVRVPNVNCARLFQNSTEEYAKAKALHRGDLIDNIHTDEWLLKETQDCHAFLEKRQYIQKTFSKAEKDFPIAFTIVAYRHMGMLERLLRSIYRPQNFYCIHIDTKTDPKVYEAVVSLARCFPNVILPEQRAEVYWGYIGVLLAEIYCMKALLHHEGWSYVIGLTAEEYPLKTNLDIVNILKAYNGANEVSNLWIGYHHERWKFVHNPVDYKTKVRKTPPPHNITIHKGDVHAVLTREFVKYVTTDKIARDFMDWLSDAFCPEELFYSSLQYNPQLKAPGAYKGDIGQNLTGTAISRHKIWTYDEIHCYGVWSKNICIYRLEALPTFIKDEHAMFINKFYKDYDPLTYDCMEELYFNRTRDDYLKPDTKNYDFYANQFFVKNHF